jgi:cytochrome c553
MPVADCYVAKIDPLQRVGYKAASFSTLDPQLSRGHIMRLMFGFLVAASMLAVPAAMAASIEAGKAKSAVCAGCHGADGNGGADPSWPKLAGQDAAYLVKQLKDFKSGARKDPIMAGMVAGLSDSDMANLGAYFASLKPTTGTARSADIAKQGERIYRGGIASRGVAACMSCHGPSGAGIPPHFPRVSGQKNAYTKKQMLAFKAGTRTNDGKVMTMIAFKLSEGEIDALSEYMAGLHKAN